MEYAGLILIVVGVGGAVLAWVNATDRLPAMPMSGADLVLLTASVAAALGILALVTLLADLDQIEGVLDPAATVVLAAAGVTMLLGALRAAGGAGAVWRSAVASSRGIKLGLAGAGLALLGWVGNLTIGVWNFSPAAVVVTLTILAAVILLAIARTRTVEPGPVPLSWIAVGVAALAGLVMFDQFGSLSRLMDDRALGIDNWLTFGVYAVGVVFLIAGAILVAVDERSAAPASTVPAAPVVTVDPEPTPSDSTV